MANKCKALFLVGFGGYENLQLQEREIPKPVNGEVLVNIKASGINFAEIMCRMGIYGSIPKLPAVLGLEGAGVIADIGDGVEEFKKGDRVMCMTNHFGLWSEYAVIPANRCFIMPDKMTFEDAAAIPVNYVTAHHMLFDMANLRQGKSVLVHMVAGGVGTAATQLIKTVPNTKIFGTCSEQKMEFMKNMGVDHPIDYRTKDYEEEIKKISPEGVDIVLDSLNGADAKKGYNLLKPMGRIIHFGAATVVTSKTKSYWQMIKLYMSTRNYNPLFINNKGAFGYHMGHLENSPEVIIEATEDIFEKYESGQIKPVIDSVWAFADVDKAMERIHQRKNIGKVILSTEMKPTELDIRNNIVTT